MASEVCPSCGVELPPDSPGGVCPNCLLDNALNSNPAAFDRAPFAATSPGPGRLTPPEVTDIADLFPHLELSSLIGYGGMGAVYQAKQKKLDRQVALKIIRGDTAADPAFAERFMREARTLARLNHPNIVAVHDFGEVNQSGDSASDAIYFFIMEYVDGANLRQLMQDGGLDSQLALSIVSQVCEALQYAHDEGIVHRDIKPENILIDARGRVKIADFGLAKLAQPSAEHFTLTGTHQVMGTPRYMAPEQMAGSREVDHRADIYSLGVVFYEMLTGQIPAGHFEPPSRHTPIDARLDGIVLRALASDPKQRFQSVTEFRMVVDQIAATTDSQQPGHAPRDSNQEGFSTIIDREAAAAWNLLGVTGDEEQQSKQRVPQLPSLLLLLVCICGCLSAFLPWSAFEITGPPQLAESDTQPFPLEPADYRFCQISVDAESDGVAAAETDSATSYSSSQRPLSVRPGETLVFYGTDHWPGFVSAILFGVLTVLMIVVPRRLQPRLFFVVLLAAASIALTVQVILYRSVVEFTYVHLVVETGEKTAEHTASPGDYQICLLQEASYERTDYRETLSSVEGRFSYRTGFHMALICALVVGVVSGLGIRQAIVHIMVSWQAATTRRAKLRSQEMAQGSGSSPGRTITSVRFRAPCPDDPGQLIRFNFEGLGYQLFEESQTEWVFKRGQKWGALWATDIGTLETTLKVRIAYVGDDDILINCEWKLVTMGVAMISKSEKKKLESEAHELRMLLDPESSGKVEKEPSTLGSIMEGADAAIDSAMSLIDSNKSGVSVGVAWPKKKDSNREYFSRRAIAGACFAPPGLIAAAIAVMMIIQSLSPIGLQSQYIYQGAFLGVISLMFGSVTTILGFIALSDIRASAGRIRGLGLAFCNAVMFPSLFTVLTIGGIAIATLRDVAPIWSGASITLVLAILLLLPLVLVVLTVRWLWGQLLQTVASERGPAERSEGDSIVRRGAYETLFQSGNDTTRKTLLKIRTAATLMKFCAVLGALHGVIFCIAMLATAPPHVTASSPDVVLGMIGGLILALIIAVVTFRAGVSLRSVRSYEFCFVGSILLLLPWTGFTWVVAFPTGVWLFHMLQRDDVKELFLKGEASS